MLEPARETAHSLAQSPAGWQQAMRAAIRDPEQLLRALDLDLRWLPAARRAAQQFDLRVPRGFVARMQPGRIDDPLLRQVLPLAEEYAPQPDTTLDAVGDIASAAPGGLLHKYHGRALLITTGACAIHCRYCFRRHFPYADLHAARQAWRPALDAIAARPDIEEVILSGGDPLSLSNQRLVDLGAALEELPQLRSLRIHSRSAVVLPERIDAGLLDWLASTRLRVIFVVHANHANEIDDTVGAGLRTLAGTGATLLNQSVLLRGVNDDAGTLARLSQRLFTYGVLPYYLHMLDRVQGAAHFDVPADRARAILESLAARLPGYLVPRLAHERAGAASKTLFGFDNASQ